MLEIDRRPLWRILGERVARPAAAVALVVTALACAGLPAPAGLTIEGYRALLVLALSLALWVLHLLPPVVTGLLAVVLLPLLDVLPRARVFSFFWNEAVFFILGEFILAAAAVRTGLAQRVGLALLARFSGSPFAPVATLLVAGGLLALFMPTNAITAMFFPIVLEITRQLSLRPGRSRFGAALLVALAWGPTCGGVATFLGSPRNPLAVAILSEQTGRGISMGLWFVATAPVSLAVGLATLAALRAFFPPDLPDVAAVREVVSQARHRLGKVSYREAGCGLIFALTVCAWLWAGESVGMGVIALGGALLALLFGVARWSDVEGDVNWGVLVMTGGAVALGATLDATGAGAWLAGRVLGWTGSPWVALLALAACAKVLSEVVSSAPAVVILVTLAIGVAPRFGIDPRVAVMVAAVPTGFAFVLPTGAPRTAIAFSAGFLRMRDVVLPGLILSAVSVACVALCARLYWPLIGMAP